MKRLARVLILLIGPSCFVILWAQNPPPAPQPPYAPPPAANGQQPPYYGQQPPQQPPYYGQQPPYDGEQPQYGPQPPSYSPQQLDGLVGRIALYPDPLLAQVLTAAVFSNQIPDAAGWARAHAYLTDGALARAIQDDRLPWDPSVIGLLPFPTVLDTMAGDMVWTQQLGDAVLANRAAVMDAVQRQRGMALSYGYLRSNPQIRVVNNGSGDIEILPAQPGYIYVPVYNPYVVYARPRPGIYVGGAIGFGPQIVVGAFAPWGWGNTVFGWRDHRILIHDRPWERAWVNRVPPPPARVEPRIERHEMREYRRPERHDGGRDRDGHGRR